MCPVSANKQMDYKFIGVLCGLAIGLIIAWILMRMTKTNANKRCEFDERQKVARGDGYKYGFWTLVICNIIYGILSIGFPKFPMDTATIVFICIVIAIVVHISYCIWHDAYFALNENRSRLMVLFAVVGVINICLGFWNLLAGEMIQDGILNFRSINLICGVLFIILFAEFLLKSKSGRIGDGE